MKEPFLMGQGNEKHKHQWLLSLLAWYIIFGALHEACHLIAAIVTGVGAGVFDEGHVLFRTLLLRQSYIPVLADQKDADAIVVSVVRHAGWIASILFLLLACKRKSRPENDVCVLAASLTALEALWSDLLCIYPATRGVFFCGNFGILMLHEAWCSADGGKTALDVLQKMIQVTMMRGAQSGGVIAFQPRSKDPNKGPVVKGIRARVVNKKRTDLSKELRKKIQREVSFRQIPFVAGHTRFATSSKATLEGTHPQQWTPRVRRRVFDFDCPHGDAGHEYKPQNAMVENYVTHNGDFDFFTLNGTTYDLEVVQRFLALVLGHPMPAAVDSCAVAGLFDLLRSQGSFALSARYACCLGLPSSKMVIDEAFPSYSHFEIIGSIFEEVLQEMLKTTTFEAINESSEIRSSFAQRVSSKVTAKKHTLIKPLLGNFIATDSEQGGATILSFCTTTIHAFFDNDLLMATKKFLKDAKGSFGLCVVSSLDANRQLCLAARGQTMSIAFYPDKGLICYGSEQAAVKAAINFEFPGANADVLGRSHGDIDNDALRLDLDDLGGEIIVLDYGCKKYKNPPVSMPHRDLMQHELMNGSLYAVLYQESKATTQDPQLYHRMTRLTRNRFIKPLRSDPKDLVASDIQDIPRVCRTIQDEWRADKASSSLNRLTAYNLSRCLRQRLEAHVAGTVHQRAVDILVTGCEVSLWQAEQFASDLQKAFPNLRIKSVSSNKLLGLYGQEIAVPTIGFPDAPTTNHLHDTIIIVVSHSGGTFAPLACSNLLQSATKNIFVVTSEWDTQIGKQLRAMDELDDQNEDHLFHTRIFSTEVGMRPAEPCSVSVVGTHQLLTNLFEYICVVILSDHRFRRVTAACISEQDLLVLERCNRENIDALCELVSATDFGRPLEGDPTTTTTALRGVGALWADHVLENARAYLLTFLYIFGTVVSGYPLVWGIFLATGIDPSSNWAYLVRLLDAAIYFWMPQINVTILRLFQGRNLLHRMVGRTVVIGDIPWVAQSAEAFLSKLFACSYSIAGLNVHSGNPSDHFVHRHTHRVVRGSLVVCGRPDGRLSALSSAEASVCLSVNQASSIQSLGGTCETVTIGHNPFKLPLSADAVFLRRKRPLFLCERMLVENDYKAERSASSSDVPEASRHGKLSWFFRRPSPAAVMDLSGHKDTSIRLSVTHRRSASALIGAYVSIEEETDRERLIQDNETVTVASVIDKAIEERKWSDQARKLFYALDLDGDGFIDEGEFIGGCYRIRSVLPSDELLEIFRLADKDGSGHLDYDEFLDMLRNTDLEIRVPPSNRDERGIVQVEASREKYFGEVLRKYNAGKLKKDVDFMLARSQHFSQELYESRIASLQRFVAMTVMFHEMGKRVQQFFVNISFGLLGYRMDRTHSIMRIATTASPISGADVRQRMRQLQLLKKVQHSIHVISMAFLQYKTRKAQKVGEKPAKSHDETNSQSSKIADFEYGC